MDKERKSSSISPQDINLFRGLSPSELAGVKACLHEKSFQKGDLLFLEGQQCERIFIVKSGRVKVFRTASSGREQILEILEPGDSCACNPGQSCWYCSSSAEALSASTVWFLSRTDYIRIVNSNSKITQTLNRLFAERLTRFCSLIEEVSLNDAKKRLVKFLIDMSNNSVLQHKGDTLFLPFTREEIAQRIGSTRETVTRYLQQLKRSKLIEIKPRQIIIRNKVGLEKFIR